MVLNFIGQKVLGCECDNRPLILSLKANSLHRKCLKVINVGETVIIDINWDKAVLSFSVATRTEEKRFCFIVLDPNISRVALYLAWSRKSYDRSGCICGGTL